MRTALPALLISSLALTACGGDSTETASSADAVSSPTAVATASAGYVAGSDVTAHAAIGVDVKRIRDLTGAAKTGAAVDWAAVGAAFTKGGGSKKSDGSNRTLAALAKEHPATAAVTAAIAAGPSDAVRAQLVDKGITVILAEKVVGELESAAEKVAAKELDPKKGAAHNVDEAWAFFVAQEQGPALTADKRGKDFGVALRQPVITALTAAQRAALAGDAAALTAATTAVRSALDHVFYLAVYKYLAHEGDAVKQAEGLGFYQAISVRVQAADPAADRAIRATLAGGDTVTGRAALNGPTVLSRLGVSAAQRVTS